MQRLPWLTLLIAGLAALLGLNSEAARLFELSREALHDGEVWRLFTGHLVHFGRGHMTWDVGALVLLGSLVERSGRRRLALALVASAAACSGAVLLFAPSILYYRGLSGLDSAVFGLLACDLCRNAWNRKRMLPALFAAVALAGFVAKVGYEVWAGDTVFAGTQGGFVPVPLVHLAGMAMGIAVSLRPSDGEKGKASTPFTSLTPQPRPDSFPTEVLHIPVLQSETSWRPTCSVTSPTTSASTSERPTRLST